MVDAGKITLTGNFSDDPELRTEIVLTAYGDKTYAGQASAYTLGHMLSKAGYKVKVEIREQQSVAHGRVLQLRL